MENNVGYALGIDLGTTFTRAAISRGDRARMVSLAKETILLPSVVRVSADGSLTTGDPGEPDGDPTRVGRDFKRRVGDSTPLMIGGQPHSAVSLMAASLKSVIATLTAAEGRPPGEVVLTCPAVWGPYRREHFTDVPRLAGVANVTILTEPEAAAYHYACRQNFSVGDVVAVYDLGGGTFDTAVARRTASGVEILGIPEGVEWVGGLDFDEAILDHVDREVGGAFSALDPESTVGAIALRRIRQECVRAKEALSREQSAYIPVRLPHRHTQVRITRAQFETMITPFLEATVAALRRALTSASITPGELKGVLLAGGSSKIPLVATKLSQDLGRPVLVDQYPQRCVALGAAAIAGHRLAAVRPVAATRRTYRPTRRAVAVTTAAVALMSAVSYLLIQQGSAIHSQREIFSKSSSLYKF